MIKGIIRSAGQTTTAFLVLSLLFMLFEPAIGYGAQMTESLTVTGEISFSTAPSNVTLLSPIGGLTGGTAVGGTQFVVLSNDSAGWSVNITASTSDGRMVGNANSANYIAGYVGNGTTTPEYNFAVNSPRGTAFGYTVAASTTADVPQNFRNNGGGTPICNSGALTNTTVAAGLHCWIAATSTPYTVLSRNSYTESSGATSTLYFRVTMNPNPNPIIPSDTYVATTTLTAIAN